MKNILKKTPKTIANSTKPFIFTPSNNNKVFQFFQLSLIMAQQTIFLHGEPYILGKDIAISIGYNLKGFKTICKSIICKEGDKFYLIDGGIKIKIQNDLKGYYLNTPQNVKKLKESI